MNELSQREIVKLNRWYEEIKAQRASGLAVMEWCTQQGKSEAGYHIVWTLEKVLVCT